MLSILISNISLGFSVVKIQRQHFWHVLCVSSEGSNSLKSVVFIEKGATNWEISLSDKGLIIYDRPGTQRAWMGSTAFWLGLSA